MTALDYMVIGAGFIGAIVAIALSILALMNSFENDMGTHR